LWDRGGTPGFPYTTDDLTNAWEDFNVTSNWATQMPCFFLSSATGFHAGQCYSAIQGTSMAAPHVAAALALTASAHPSLRKHPGALLTWLKAHANTNVHNLTQVLSATDTSGGDLNHGRCWTATATLVARGSATATPMAPASSTSPTQSDHAVPTRRRDHGGGTGLRLAPPSSIGGALLLPCCVVSSTRPPPSSADNSGRPAGRMRMGGAAWAAIVVSLAERPG
jgi:subtilisin family serine protease